MSVSSKPNFATTFREECFTFDSLDKALISTGRIALAVNAVATALFATVALFGGIAMSSFLAWGGALFFGGRLSYEVTILGKRLSEMPKNEEVTTACKTISESYKTLLEAFKSKEGQVVANFLLRDLYLLKNCANFARNIL